MRGDDDGRSGTDARLLQGGKIGSITHLHPNTGHARRNIFLTHHHDIESAIVESHSGCRTHAAAAQNQNRAGSFGRDSLAPHGGGKGFHLFARTGHDYDHMFFENSIGHGVSELAMIPQAHHVDTEPAAQVAFLNGHPAKRSLLHRCFGNDQRAESGKLAHTEPACHHAARQRTPQHLAELEHPRTAGKLEYFDGFITFRTGYHGNVAGIFAQ